MNDLQMHKKIDSQAVFNELLSPREVGMFMVFAFEGDCPKGGFNDYIGMALSPDHARSLVAEKGITLGGYQIVNYKNMEVFESGTIGWQH